VADYPRLAVLVYKFLVLVFYEIFIKLFPVNFAIPLAPLPLRTVSVAFVIPNVNSAALSAAYSNFRVPNALTNARTGSKVFRKVRRYQKNSTPLISSQQGHMGEIFIVTRKPEKWNQSQHFARRRLSTAGIPIDKLNLPSSVEKGVDEEEFLRCFACKTVSTGTYRTWRLSGCWFYIKAIINRSILIYADVLRYSSHEHI